MYQIEIQVKDSLGIQKIIMQEYYIVILTNINMVLEYLWLSENNPDVN
jgi:hypothetical protein